MLYTLLFLARFLPFWAVPVALVFFELGIYHYGRRRRSLFLACFGVSGVLLISSILWIVYDGYWRAGMFLKRFIEG